MYPAELASALINVATKAGTNAFRGSVFEFLRNDAFDSRNYFAPKDQPKPPLNQNQFGGSLGGPIASNRTFYLGVTFKVEQRLRNNYAYNVHYTLSTSKDDASGPRSDLGGNERAAERTQHL